MNREDKIFLAFLSLRLIDRIECTIYNATRDKDDDHAETLYPDTDADLLNRAVELTAGYDSGFRYKGLR